MADAVFVDTNVLLYAASDGKRDASKTSRSRQLLRERPWVISIQVVQEFHVNATRKAALGIGSEKAARLLDELLARVVVGMDAALFRRAVTLQARHGISYRDAAVVAAARAAGCDLLFSEDLNSGQDYGGVLVIDPFREDPGSA